MSQWQILLDRAVTGLDRLRKAEQPIPEWVLGGGTALMLHYGHRLSKDIDIFIHDPQYLPFLTPRLGGEGIWECETFEEAAQHLKLIFPEGEIDFIVAASITDLSPEQISVDIGRARAQVIDVEHPVEIALKKLAYRGLSLKIRDIFDIAVVEQYFPDLLRLKLVHVTESKTGILARLDGISESFLRLELDELDISADWRAQAESCLARVRALVDAMPGLK